MFYYTATVRTVRRMFVFESDIQKKNSKGLPQITMLERFQFKGNLMNFGHWGSFPSRPECFRCLKALKTVFPTPTVHPRLIVYKARLFSSNKINKYNCLFIFDQLKSIICTQHFSNRIKLKIAFNMFKGNSFVCKPKAGLETKLAFLSFMIFLINS